MKKQINLNPKAIEKNKKSNIGKFLIGGYLLIVIILFINAGIIYYENRALEKNNLVIKSEVKNYKEADYDYSNIVNDIKNKEDFINKIKLLEKNISAWEYVDTLKKYFPQNVYLEDISFDSDGINMDGVADTKEEVAVFLANLQMSKIYKNAKLTSLENVEITIDDNEKEDNNISSAVNSNNTNDVENNDNTKDNDKTSNKKEKKDEKEKDKKAKEKAKKPKVINKVKFTISVEGVKAYEKK